MNSKYIFESDRLGFRNWSSTDLSLMMSINADPEVMKFFPSTQTESKTLEFIERMSTQFKDSGFCYFAVEVLQSNEFIGFIGLSRQTFDVDYAPFIDIGWRLKKSVWGKGYATEGAKKCLKYAFNNLNLGNIYSTAPVINTPSISIMKKIGMSKIKEFEHPLLLDNDRLKMCVLYSIKQ